MIRSKELNQKTKDRLTRDGIQLQEQDILGIWCALRQGFVSAQTLRQAVYDNYRRNANISTRLSQIVANGYLKRVSYSGIKYGDQPRLTNRGYIATPKAAELFNATRPLPRIDNRDAWIGYYTDSLVRELHANGIALNSIFTSSQVKHESCLLTPGMEDLKMRAGIPAHEHGDPFHLILLAENGSRIYVYFLPTWVTVSIKDIAKGAKKVSRAMNILLTRLPPGDLYVISCPREHYSHNAVTLCATTTDTRTYLVSTESLMPVLLSLSIDPLFYQRLLERDYGMEYSHGTFGVIPAGNNEYRYIIETVSGKLRNISGVLRYMNDKRPVTVISADYQEDLLSGQNTELIQLSRNAILNRIKNLYLRSPENDVSS